MNQDKFWQIIESAHTQVEGDPEAQIEAIQTQLEQLTPEEILEFQRIFWRLHRRSYRADLWGAAYIMNGGCSDDGFDYFRGWLIAQGREVFENALQNPDSIADVLPDEPEQDTYELEDMLGVGLEPWKQKTDLEMNDFYDQLGENDEPSPELGEFEWSDGSDISSEKGPELYPKLWVKFAW